MFHSEALRFSFQALQANKFRAFLTALGLVIGNASVILVVTISLTSRDYILDQIQRIGSNLIYAQYESGNNTTGAAAAADYVKIADVDAVREQLRPHAHSGRRRRRGDHRLGPILSGSAQSGFAGRPLLRCFRCQPAASRGVADGTPRPALVWQPERGRRPDRQAARFAIHGDRDLQRKDRKLRTF